MSSKNFLGARHTLSTSHEGLTHWGATEPSEPSEEGPEASGARGRGHGPGETGTWSVTRCHVRGRGGAVLGAGTHGRAPCRAPGAREGAWPDAAGLPKCGREGTVQAPWVGCRGPGTTAGRSRTGGLCATPPPSDLGLRPRDAWPSTPAPLSCLCVGTQLEGCVLGDKGSRHRPLTPTSSPVRAFTGLLHALTPTPCHRSLRLNVCVPRVPVTKPYLQREGRSRRGL